MPHLPQPARSRAMAVNRVVRRAAKSPLPEVQAPDIKAAVSDAVISSDAEMIGAAPSEN